MKRMSNLGPNATVDLVLSIHFLDWRSNWVMPG